MSILLTGASGYVGRHVLETLLLAGASVQVAGRHRPSAPGDFEWHSCDLLKNGTANELIATTKPTHIIHLAWCVEHGKFWTDPDNRKWKDATIELVQAAKRNAVNRFIGVGTCYEYDWPPQGVCNETETKIATHTLYDQMKVESFREIRRICVGSDVSFGWARLFFLYGPFESPGRLVPSIARALVRGEQALCSSGRVLRDFMDVRDAGAALAAFAVSNVEGPVNIGSGVPVSVASVASRLAELCGRPDLLRIGALPDRLEEPPIIVAKTDRLVYEVGYRSTRSLDEGLKNALSYWADHEGVSFNG